MKSFLSPMFIFVSLLFLLSSCMTLAVGSAVVATATFVRQDKSIAQSIDDVKITIEANKLLYANNFDGCVKVRVTERNVVLIGNVSSKKKKENAESIVANIPNVKKVVSELVINSKYQAKIKSEVLDASITATLKAKLLLDSRVRSGNYSITTIDSIVYVLGVSHDNNELDAVLSTARHMSGVKSVVSYVLPVEGK